MDCNYAESEVIRTVNSAEIELSFRKIKTLFNDSASHNQIIQQASVPLKNYPNMNYGVLKTNVNNTDYLIIIYGEDFSNSYLDYTGSNAQKALMKHKIEYMINEGHLHSSIDDVQYYGDFTKAPSEYKGY